MPRVVGFAVLAALAAALAPSRAQEAVEAPALGVSGTQFTVDAEPRFLVGVSLFDALGPTAPSDEDLDTLAGWRIEIVRVWAHWSEPIYARDGSLTSQGRRRLEGLLDRLAARRLLLELVLLRPGQLQGQRFAVFESAGARVRGVGEIAAALRGRQNVLFDLYNEHDHRDGPMTHAEARALRDAVKSADPDRLVTISSTESHLVNEDGTLDETLRANLGAEVGSDPGAVRVDVVAAHLPRTHDWAEATSARVKAIRDELGRLRVSVPIYLNEERRTEPGRAAIPAAAYIAAASGALEAGAAGWIFHTGAGYRLSQSSFLRALGVEERRALESRRR